MFRFASIIVLALISQSAMAVYKWVDEKGVTHYGDTLPPQAVSQGSSQLNKSGQVVKETSRAMTEEERKAEADEKARKIDEEQKALEQKRRDRALLDSYTNVKDIELARDRNLQATQVLIDSTQVRVKSIQTRLDGLRKQADPLTKAKKPIPADLAADLKLAEDEIRRFQGSIAKHHEEIKAIKERFEEDKKRYLELKGYPAVAPATK